MAETTQTPEAAAPAANAGSKSGAFPDELRGWNWGAFFLGWIWAIGMSNVIAFLLCFFLGFIGNIIVGITGNEWSWKSRRFSSVEEFRAVQHAWAVWGVVLFIASILISFGIVLFTVILASSTAINSSSY